MPFHCLITGPTNCGKTNYLVEQLRGPFRHTFEYIVLICPTYPHNSTYRGFANGDPRFIVLCTDSDSTDEIDELLSCCQTFFSKTNTLLILDDCAVSKDLKKRSNKFINLAFSGRHEGISVWVLTQQLTSISKPCSGLSPNEQKKITDILKTVPYSKLCFCLRYPYTCYCDIPSPAQLIDQ